MELPKAKLDGGESYVNDDLLGTKSGQRHQGNCKDRRPTGPIRQVAHKGDQSHRMVHNSEFAMLGRDNIRSRE